MKRVSQLVLAGLAFLLFASGADAQTLICFKSGGGTGCTPVATGSPLPVSIAAGGGGAVTIANGADVAEGLTTDTAATAGGTGTLSAKLRLMTTQLGTINTTLGSPFQAGAALAANQSVNLTQILGAAPSLTWNKITPELALQTVLKMEPGTFVYKKDSGLPEGEHIGFNAEQMATIDERLVSRDGNGKLRGVRYQQDSALYAGAIQALKVENDNLRKCQVSWKCRILGIR